MPFVEHPWGPDYIPKYNATSGILNGISEQAMYKYILGWIISMIYYYKDTASTVSFYKYVPEGSQDFEIQLYYYYYYFMNHFY